MIVVAKDLVDVQLYSSEAITVRKEWLKGVGPLLTVDKTEAELIMKHRKETIVRITIWNHTIISKAATEWMMTDAGLDFKQYL